MKIIIDKNKCIGCGTCQAICGDFFELGDDSKAHLKIAPVKDEGGKEEAEALEVGCAQPAADSCPTESIAVEK